MTVYKDQLGICGATDCRPERTKQLSKLPRRLALADPSSRGMYIDSIQSAAAGASLLHETLTFLHGRCKTAGR